MFGLVFTRLIILETERSDGAVVLCTDLWPVWGRKQPNDELADVRSRALTELSLRMKDSGYLATFHYEVIAAAVVAYERQVERAEDWTCLLYRPKGYMAEERKKNDVNKMCWYRPYDSVLLCPPTPGSLLVRQLRRVKGVERDGRKLWHQMHSYAPGAQL
jgi:hypothetical protein